MMFRFRIMFRVWLCVMLISCVFAGGVYSSPSMPMFRSPEDGMANICYVDLLALQQMAGFDGVAARKQVEGYTAQLKQKTGIDFLQSMRAALANNGKARNVKIISSKEVSGITTFDRVISRINSNNLPPHVRPVTLYCKFEDIGEIGFTALFVEDTQSSAQSILMDSFSVMIVNEGKQSILSQDKEIIDAVVMLFYMPTGVSMNYFNERIRPSLSRWIRI